MQRGDGRRFFSTAQYYRPVTLARDGAYFEPTSVVHAKEMGTPLTACGLRADSWFKFWDEPFDTNSHEKCLDCMKRLDELRRDDRS